ncbi:hypothetical protein [Halalkalicoccus ordinarius]|uniref:hypothetical protein n=1 Tax=Halalkalicoccus ordinarius TaxID=3116651 RepID=UPI00300F32E8
MLPALDEMNYDERSAVEEIERGLESCHRAYGALVEFHHAAGRAIEHFDEAEGRLREEHDDIADRPVEDALPTGVTADGKPTHELVAEFEDDLLAAVESTADSTSRSFADERRYLRERAERDQGADSSE